MIDGVTDGVIDGVGVILGVIDGVGVTLGVAVGVGVAVNDGVGDGDGGMQYVAFLQDVPNVSTSMSTP